MRSHVRVGVAAVAAVLALASIAPVSANSRTATRWVDDDGRAGPTSCGGSRTAARKIQSAVNRSDQNDVIIVCPGTYTETVRIEGRRTGLTIRAKSRGSAIIRAPHSLTAGPLLWIAGVEGVTIQSMTLSFRSAGCEPRTAEVNGMFARDADGLRIIGNKVQATGTDTQGPCGFIDGIRVYSTTSARVSNNTVRDFKSDGISFERGSRGRIDGNAVQFYHGASTRDSDGDQGIRVVTGARAEVTGNLIRSLSATGTPRLEIGISLQDTSGISDIHHNDLRYVKTGIGLIDSRARVRSNDLRGTGPATGLLYGIHLLGGTGTEVLSNTVRDFDLGLFVEATASILRNNVATGSMTRGCLDTTTGTGTAGTANTWSGNVGTPASSPEAICPAP